MGHNREYVHKIGNGLVRKEKFRVIVVAGGDYRPSEAWGRQEYEAIRFKGIDFGRTEAKRFAGLGRLAFVARGIVRLSLNMRFMQQFNRLLGKEKGPAIVHILDYEYISLWLGSFSWGKRSSIAIVLTGHLADFDRSLLSIRGIYKRIVKYLWGKCIVQSGAIIIHGEEIKRRLLKQLPNGSCNSRKMIIAQYPADEEGAIISKAQARERLGIPEDVKVVLFFGMIRPDKRLDVIIKACALCDPSIWLVIAGSPQLVSESKIDGWLANANLVRRSVRELRYIGDEEIALFYSCADIFVATHDGTFCSQSGPLSLCRTYRLPAVVSDVAEIGQFIKRHGLGLTASPGDPKSFADAINHLLSNENEYKTIQVALEKAAYAFSWDRFCSTLEEAYLYALGQGTKSDRLHRWAR
jgi:glycosyltransferase involved in cell wall biosynthesis